MPSTYADVREALFDELQQIVPKVLEFNTEEEIAVGENEWELIIRTETTTTSGIPFLSLPDKDYRRKGPGSPIAQLHRMLGFLIRDRMWRERGGPAPDSALFKTNQLTAMLLYASKTSPQEFVDAVWDPVDLHEGWSEAHEWQSDLALPDTMKQSPAAQRGIRHPPQALQWISGVSLHDEIFVDALALYGGAALYRLTRFGPTELRLPVGPEEIVQMPAEGQPVGKISWRGVELRCLEPLLVDDLRYAGSSSEFKRSLRLMLDGDFLWQSTHFGGADNEAVRAEYNRRLRQLFLKRARIEATIVRHLQPFTETDTANRNCQRRYKMGPATGLKVGQSIQTKSLSLRLGLIGVGEAAVA